LHASGALAGLPYTIEVKRDDPDAFFIASRYPLAAPTIVYRYGRPLIVKTAIDLPSGSQPLWVVHTTAPLLPAFSQWKGQVATIAAEIKATGTAHLLVAGDFNSTWSNKGFRQILAEGMTDGAAARGHPFDMTWSQTKQPLPPLVRIDHVLTGPGVAVTAIASGPGPGSDHRDLHATIAFER
jgi:endonuclease/exonuclease/phosphatase (EEP) superfamily protein YafD